MSKEEYINVNCSMCLNTNLMMLDGFEAVDCPYHAPFIESVSVQMFREAVAVRQFHSRLIAPNEFELAQFLTHFHSEHTCQRVVLEELFCSLEMPRNNERRIKKLIENLRHEWLLPIGSFKTAPFGYYFITDESDFLRWQKENMSGALTQLSTNWIVYKHNFRRLAGQNDLDFSTFVGDQISELEKEAA